MSGAWIRVPPERSDHARALVAAGAVAAGVGLVTFYVTRLLLARERLGEGVPPEGDDPGAGEERGA